MKRTRRQGDKHTRNVNAEEIPKDQDTWIVYIYGSLCEPRAVSVCDYVTKERKTFKL